MLWLASLILTLVAQDKDLVVVVQRSGEVKIAGKIVIDAGKPYELALFQKAVEAHKGGKLYLDVHPAAEFAHIQSLFWVSLSKGGFKAIVIRPINREEKLSVEFPVDKGLAPAVELELREIRVIVCAGGELRGHRNNRKKHDGAKKKADECHVWVEKIRIGKLTKKDHTDEGKAINRKAIKAMCDKVKELQDATGGKRVAPVILDIDNEVPFRHVLKILLGLKAKKVRNIEFVMSPLIAEKMGN